MNKKQYENSPFIGTLGEIVTDKETGHIFTNKEITNMTKHENKVMKQIEKLETKVRQLKQEIGIDVN